ncbi:DNA methylase [Stackebrandtia endophytica]|uniref:Methyltransferase n=1 Tax=Stackebrandtia endophytica TaxID=1496996 RepID=A0A543ARY1_9ACTN|nr:DNA methyltransferase [Stackebrandtia endophytica]TQL75341.1 DNA methylase [Stackebrandtia endophytica]
MTKSRRSRGSVWLCGQTSPRVQRLHRYARSSVEHPAKMFPAIARYAITAYTRPGDVVVDPMCGIGTTIVEAVELGRPAFGVEYEPAWSGTAAANLYLARQRGTQTPGSVVTGDARHLPDLLPAEVVGRVRLVLTSPPYGALTHGRVRQNAAGRIVKLTHQYSPNRADRDQLAHRNLDGLTTGMVEVFAACRQVLAPGGVVVVSVRPWIENGALIDFPSMMVTAATGAGLVPRERCVAVLAAWRDGALMPHHSFFALHNTRQARAKGQPRHLIVHEDVLAFGRLT